MGSYMTGSGQKLSESEYIKYLVEKDAKVIYTKEPKKKKRSKIYRWITGQK
jgi:hypothetical protein